MTFSYDYFDKLVARQCAMVWNRISKSYPEARSPKKGLELGTGFIQLYYGAKDAFGTRIIEAFQHAYDLGMPLDEVLHEFVEQFQKQAAEQARPKEYTRKTVHRTIGEIPIPLTVSHIEQFENGKLVSKQYRDSNGGIRIESTETHYLMSFYQQKALENPDSHNIFKFLASNACVKHLAFRLEKENEKAANQTPIIATLTTAETIKPMDWNGTQKQLGELFVELKRKGWIDEFSFEGIQAAFTKSASIDQTLRPGKSPNKEGTFGGIYTVNYKPCFDKIKRHTPDKPSEAIKKS